MEELRPFSEGVNEGMEWGEVGVGSGSANIALRPKITTDIFKQGTDVIQKLNAFTAKAGIDGERKESLRAALNAKWKKIEETLPDEDHKWYHDRLLKFLIYYDNEYLLSGILKGKDPIPPRLQEHLANQIKELEKKPAKERTKSFDAWFPQTLIRALRTYEKKLREGKKEPWEKHKTAAKIERDREVSKILNHIDEYEKKAKETGIPYPEVVIQRLRDKAKKISSTDWTKEKEVEIAVADLRKYLVEKNITPVGSGLSKTEQEKIYASPGAVPTWWFVTEKDKGTYKYHASKAIKACNVSARDVRFAVEKAAAGKPVSDKEFEILTKGWGFLGGRKVLSGKYPVTEQMLQLYGEFYHRDVGWY